MKSKVSAMKIRKTTARRERPDRGLVDAVCLVLEPVDFYRRFGDPLAPFERLERFDDLIGGRHDNPRELARLGTHALDLVEPHDRRRRVDRVHDVIQRSRQLMDVFTIEGRDERPMQPLDDLVRQEVAFVLDFLDLIRLVANRLLGREHLPEQRGAAPDFLRQRDEIIVKPLFLRQQSECHKLSRRNLSRSPSVFTCRSHGCNTDVTCGADRQLTAA